MTDKLEIPANISIVALPAKCPELNPVRTSGSSCATTGCPTASSSPRQHHRSVLRSLEQARRSALVHHDEAAAQIGAWVVMVQVRRSVHWECLIDFAPTLIKTNQISKIAEFPVTWKGIYGLIRGVVNTSYP